MGQGAAHHRGHVDLMRFDQLCRTRGLIERAVGKHRQSAVSLGESGEAGAFTESRLPRLELGGMEIVEQQLAELRIDLGRFITIAPSTAGVERDQALASLSDRQTSPAQDKSEKQMDGNTQAPKTKRIGIVVYDDFETLDVFGPVQMWGRLPDYELVFVSQKGTPVRSAQGLSTPATFSFDTAPQFEILMVPGGQGSRVQVDNPAMLAFLRKQNSGTEWTTSVCTGSTLLAKAGILDGRGATTNKVAFGWVAGQSARVDWHKKARWVVDGKFMTSSGVSAGTDMALALVEKLYGRDMADSVSRTAEYCWNDNPQDDPFADAQG